MHPCKACEQVTDHTLALGLLLRCELLSIVVCAVLLQVLGMDVPVNKALAGCAVAAGVVGLLAVIRVLSVVLGVVPDSIKLAVVSERRLGVGGGSAC